MEGVSLFEVQRRLGFCRQYVVRARANIHQHPVIVLPTTRVAGCCRHRLVEFQSLSRLRIAVILRRFGPHNHSSAVGSPRWRVLQISASWDPGTPDTLWNGRNDGKRNMKKNFGFEPTEFGALKHGFRFPIILRSGAISLRQPYQIDLSILVDFETERLDEHC